MSQKKKNPVATVCSLLGTILLIVLILGCIPLTVPKAFGYNIYTVPEKLSSFTSRKLFPKEWAGLKDKELQKVTTVETARFCHNKCFICAVETKEDALKLAKIANGTY